MRSRSVRRWLPAGPAGVALSGLLVVGGLALLALLAPVVLPGSPTEIAKDLAMRAPTLAEPFGMDDLGRSVLSRVVHAYRVSLGVALGSVALALVNGSVGVVVAPRGRLSTVLTFEIRRGKIAEIDVLTDPARLRQLHLAVLEA